MQDAATVLGNFFKVLAAVIIFGFAVVLEYTFFQSISPADKPWFPYLAMGLTAGGFVCWMFTFRLIKHNPLHTMLAWLMMVGCAGTSLIVAGTEFYSWIAEHYNIATNPQMYQNVTTMLLVIFCGHVIALLVDVSCGHFAKNPFRGGGNLIPASYAQSGNLIPMYPQYPQYQNALPQYAEGRGEPANPLASRSNRRQPKEAPTAAPRSLENSEEIELPAEEEMPVRAPRKQLLPIEVGSEWELEGLLREDVSSLMQKGKDFISSIRTVHRARGKTNGTTNGNT